MKKTTNTALDWDQVEDNFEQVEYLKMKQGMSRIRLAGNPAMVDVHWVKGKDSKKHVVACDALNCPFCQNGSEKKTRIVSYAFDRDENNKLKIVDVGPSIAKQIKALAKNEDYGCPENYDIKINRTGKGLETRYTISPSPKKSPLTLDERSKVAKQKPFAELYKIKTPEELEQMGIDID